MTESIQTIKADLRRTVRARLGKMSAAQREHTSAEIVQRLIDLDALAQAKMVMLYMPIATEVDVTAAAHWCLENDKVVCVPKTDWARRDMDAVRVDDLGDDAMTLDRHGIRTPHDGRVVATAELDVVVVPGLAFTTSGHRLGRGAGYYDRFLKRLGDEAYGLAVKDELESVAGRSPSSGALYTTLDRMERKGLLESHAGESTEARGGRARRYLRLTAEGREILARSRSALLALWDGLEGALDG